VSFHLEQFRVNSIVPRCDYEYEDDLGTKNSDSDHDVVLAKTKVEFGVAGNPNEADEDIDDELDEDLDNGLGEAEVGLGGNLGKAKVDLDGNLGKAEVVLGGNLGEAEVDLHVNLGKAEVDLHVNLDKAEEDIHCAQVINRKSTLQVDANHSDVASDLTDVSSASSQNPWKQGKLAFTPHKDPDFILVERTRIPRGSRVSPKKISTSSSVSSDSSGKEHMTHEQVCDLLLKCVILANKALKVIKNGIKNDPKTKKWGTVEVNHNDVFHEIWVLYDSEQNLHWVDIIPIAFMLHGSEFNPKMFSNSKDAKQYWQKFAKYDHAPINETVKVPQYLKKHNLTIEVALEKDEKTVTGVYVY